jgi:chromosome segregation ATPase
LSDSYEAEIQSLEARIESLQAQLAQAEDACHQMQTEHSATDAVKAVRLEIAEEIENHSYLAGTHEMCVWIDSLTKRLHEEAKEKNVTP